MNTVRLTMAQALISFLEQQYLAWDDQEVPFVEGIFMIPGHGNVVGLGQAIAQEAKRLKIYQGKNEQAMEMWREAESRDPLSPQIAFLRARSQHKLGNSGAALQSIQRSLELFSNSRQVYRFRAQIMIEQGRTWEGIEDWVDSQVIDEGI